MNFVRDDEIIHVITDTSIIEFSICSTTSLTLADAFNTCSSHSFIFIIMTNFYENFRETSYVIVIRIPEFNPISVTPELSVSKT